MKFASYRYGTIVEIKKADDSNTFVTIAKDKDDIYTYTRLVVSDKTLIMNCDYQEVTIDDLNIGDCIFVYHSNAMTLSIPPQTSAFIIEIH